jgi:hypothetical protein
LTREEQLAWERQAARPAAGAAFASALLGMASLAVGAGAGLLSPADDRLEVLLRNHRHPGAYLSSAVLQALSVAAIAAVLAFLYRAAKFRRPEIPRGALYLAVVAPPVVAVLTVVNGIQTLAAADRVASKVVTRGGGPKAAVKFAEHEVTKGGGATVGYLAVAAGLSLAFAVGFNSINARRAGLLSQFMGIVGVIVGVLLVIPILGPPLVQFFWFVAVGLLFLDRWPGGRKRGPAWETGEADPWPTMSELRAAEMAERGEEPPPRRRGLFAPPEPRPEPEDDYEDEYEEDEEPAATPHPRSKKRKRKRRR